MKFLGRHDQVVHHLPRSKYRNASYLSCFSVDYRRYCSLLSRFFVPSSIQSRTVNTTHINFYPRWKTNRNINWARATISEASRTLLEFTTTTTTTTGWERGEKTRQRVSPSSNSMSSTSPQVQRWLLSRLIDSAFQITSWHQSQVAHGTIQLVESLESPDVPATRMRFRYWISRDNKKWNFLL